MVWRSLGGHGRLCVTGLTPNHGLEKVGRPWSAMCYKGLTTDHGLEKVGRPWSAMCDRGLTPNHGLEKVGSYQPWSGEGWEAMVSYVWQGHQVNTHIMEDRDLRHKATT
ncbi:Hypp373 [Branchiostoma lanceolatum]|uniref:Hypp373 protein n=1 Tax=Branchiostoma lanceolatum TaxID=7740 RepID=A0A8J9VUC5_BRALA|nr:Hypp373 [Branchiostoma lanceolatum]